MNSSPTYLAIALNHEGLDYLEERCYENAIESLSKGLGLIKSELADGSNVSCTSRCDAESCSSSKLVDDQRQQQNFCGCCAQHQASFAPLLHFRNLKTDTGSMYDDDDDEMEVGEQAAFMLDGCSEAYVFDKPIDIAFPSFFSPSLSSRPCHRYLVSLAFVLVFNLAMTYHLLAIEEEAKTTTRRSEDQAASASTAGSHIKRLYQKAVALYEMAYSVQTHEDAINTTVLQTMVMVNNLGQLHAKLGNKEQARHCFETLLSTMMFVAQDPGCCCEEDAHHAREAGLYMNDFLTNVLFLILPKPRPAAAA
ncbi:hypothetical protein ACA910_018755 [Epithemia clementina (nom. ined.)]